MSDLEKYPTYLYKDGKIISIYLCDLEGLCLINYDWHHFLRKTIRKNSPKDYERWEHYQRMILMPHEMNIDIEGYSEKGFENKWGVPLCVMAFNRNRWRCGFYESKFFTSFYE